MMDDAASAAWWQTRAAAALFALVAALPLVWATIPWMSDVPAHAARYHIQEALPHSAALARHFTFTWRFIPNLGVDLMVIPLERLFGLLPAVTIATATIPVLTVAGLLWMAREAHGRVPATSLFALPLAYSYPFQFGFLNSCLSVAIAFVAFAWWLRLRHRRWAQAAMLAVAAALTVVAHITGWGVLGVLVGGATLAELVEQRSGIGAGARRLVLAVLPLLWPLVVLAAWNRSGDNEISWWFRWDLDATWLMSILRDRWLAIDLVATIAVYGAATLPLWWRRRFGYLLALAIPAAILTALGLVMANKLLGSMFAAVRLIPVGVAVAIAAVRPRRALPRWVAWLALALFAARLISVTVSQRTTEATAQQQLAALDHLPVGSRVMALTVERCDRAWAVPRLWHLSSMATIRRDALVNDLFATSGQLLGIRNSGDARWLALEWQAVPRRGCARAQWPVFDDVLARVPWGEVDYLWVLSSDHDRIGRRYPVQLTWDNGHTQLYRVVAGQP